MVLATTVLLAACGDGTSTSAPTTSPEATSRPAATVSAGADAGTRTRAVERSLGGAADAQGGDVAVALVQDWLAALRDGDLAAARAGLGEASAQAVAPAGGLQGLASGLSEGMAAFADPGGDVRWTAAAVPGHPDTFAVTAVGEVEREGLVETAARAWLVHPDGDRLVVEAFSPHPSEVVRPVPGEPVPLDHPVEADLAPGVVHAVVDGAVLDGAVIGDGESEASAAGDRLRVRVLPDGGWAPGRRTVTLVSVPEQTAAGAGPWAAAAVTFEAS